LNSQGNVSHIIAEKLKEIIEPLCCGYSDYALLDFPAHSNVGDSAIYLGELALFDKVFKKPPSYVCTKKDSATDIRKFDPNGIIFLHGGGNFGDIWPAHQKFFERILRQYPEKKIVQLPQSIHFSSKDAIEKTAKAIRNHNDFTLLVRDIKSFEFANSHFDCDVKLCPDSAYALGNFQFDEQSIAREVLCLLRTDKERYLSSSDQTRLERLGAVEDWLAEKSIKTCTDRMENLLFRCLPQMRTDLMPKKELMFRRHAQIRLERGIAQLCSAKWIVSDRLHVHILAMLLKKEHFVLDNSYNKLRNFISSWPVDDTTHVVDDVSELEISIKKLRGI
jgi:pyruvyl transferase EpsO